MKRILFLAVVSSLFAAPLRAQDSLKHITFAVGAGFSFPVGAVKAHTKTGFNFVASAGPRFNPRFTLTVDFSLHYTEG